jgi:5-oxopent-3-ene-1,2,5-tricarboxylate decarboxylase/2-hydroxyhepta-2,4-diene-1,7-dioate isomerase
MKTEQPAVTRMTPTPSNSRPLTAFWPNGTVYGTLLNFKREFDFFAPQMTQAPYKAAPKAPVLYVKTANTFNADGGQVPVPSRVPQVEVGATLAMVVGARGEVGGWVLVNDFSVPHASYFRPPVKFKCLDGFLGLGSACVAANELGEPSQVQLEVRVNGGLVQTIDFSQLVRPAARLLQDVMAFMSLREGDWLMLGLDCLPDGTRPLAQVGDRVEIHSPTHADLGRLMHTLTGELA